ncbi:hypothetical protein [Salarchaeum japonicum]|uniref:Transcriptional regulator n=1 Tax=Salarchaeum japonicum TaxID=555573 RepID=A0AAV3SXP5_9EURY|nr:hypothetical protein [Salarchaeum japonicum]
MGEHAIPKGVDRDTLLDVIAGWAEAGAADDPVYTKDVADELDVSDAVGRQTPFLEELGVLDPDGQQHELTDAGERLATALRDGDTDAAREHARRLLDDWPPTADVRGLLRDNSLGEERLHALLAALTDHEPEGRADTGLHTLLDLYVWTGVLERDDDTYRLPDADTDESLDSLVTSLLASDALDVNTDPGTRPGSDALALSLDLSLDAEPDEIEDLVRAIRRGLTDET